jgi:hypothetical protein
MSQSVMFSTKTVRARKTRYTLADASLVTAEGGRVGVGRDQQGEDYLVHTDIPGRQPEAMSLGAVATAVAGGAVPVDALVGAFIETGKLPSLKNAIAKAERAFGTPARAPRKAKKAEPAEAEVAEVK